MQNFFTKLLEDDIKAVMKPQYVDQIPKAIKGEVDAMMKKKGNTTAAQHRASLHPLPASLIMWYDAVMMHKSNQMSARHVRCW